MSKTLTAALFAVLSLSTLAGCNHFHRDAAPAHMPVVETPAPQPTFDSKFR